MKTLHGLDYSLKIKNTIINHINQAQKNPFINYYFIVDDPLYFEEAFFKYTDTLFNIRIITYNDLIKKLLEHYQLYSYQELSKLDKILITKQLIENSNNLFNTNSKMDLIYELIDIFDLFFLESFSNSELDQLPPLAKQKIATIIGLYQQLTTSLPNNTCYKYEELLFEQIDNSNAEDHYIFISEQIFKQRRFELIKKISLYNDVTILVNNSSDSRDLNKPFNKYHGDQKNVFENDNPYLSHLNKYLFSLRSPKYENHTPLHTIIQTTPKAQIESVVLNIYQDIVDNHTHYHDYAIYYPNQEYLTLLVDTLNNFKIPHNIKKSLIFKELDACLLWIRYCLNHDNNDLLDLLDTKVLSRYNDFDYLDLIKKNYLEKGYIEDPFSTLYNFEKAQSLDDYSSVMINFINQEMLFSQNQTMLINFFTNLTSPQSFTLADFYSLVNQLKPSLKEDIKPCNDHLYLLNYQQCYSGILECKKIYLVGVNETVVPKQNKDTGILLDQDYQILQLPDLNHQISVDQNNILKVLNSQTEFTAICFSNGTIDGQPLLKSSLYNQLKQMFKISNIDINNDYYHYSLKTNLYLHGGKDIELSSLNTMIKHYIQTNNQPDKLTVPLFSNHLSASKLETYNGCPYKYFNQYGLKLYPFKQPLFQINEIGTIIHYVLEKTQALFTDNITASKAEVDDLETVINQHVEQYLNEHGLTERLNYGTNNYIIKTVKHDLVNTVIVLINQMKASDFYIVGSEVDIYRNYPDFKFSGIVDRVDQYNQYLKIIDYKSSNKDLDLSLAIQGFNIQMLLYLDTLTKQKKLDKGALLYFNTKKRILTSSLKINESELSENFFKLYRMNGYVNSEVVEEVDNNIDKDSAIIKAKFVKKDDCYKGNILSSFSFERLIDYVSQHIENLYHELANGNIGINPKGSDDATVFTKVNPCTYCNYRSLCNFDVFYNEYTLVDSNNLEHLLEEDNSDAN